MARGVRALANTCRHYAWREYDVAISKYLYQADQGKINAVVATLLPPCIALSAVAGAAVGQRQQRVFFSVSSGAGNTCMTLLGIVVVGWMSPINFGVSGMCGSRP